MAEEKRELPGEEPDGTGKKKEEKPAWQKTKEYWYDKIPLTLKQLDIIVGICLALLALTFIAICLDAMDIFNLFG